jgi:serine/threonine protein kinase
MVVYKSTMKWQRLLSTSHYFRIDELLPCISKKNQFPQIGYYLAAGIAAFGITYTYTPTKCDVSSNKSLPFTTYENRGTLDDFKKRYSLGPKLGQGTFAQVFRGVDLETKEVVAVKEISKALSGEPTRRAEVQIMERMGIHPNLVRLHHVFESEDKLFLVEDLADEGELFDRIIASGELSEQDAAIFFSQATAALDHLHKKHIVHLDVKPENLLLRKVGGETILQLADFGLAEVDDGRGFDMCVGTPAYWSPQMVKRDPYDKAADIWALGCVLYILLCGIHPFDPSGESTEVQVLARVATADYDKSNKEYKSLSQAAKDLILHLLDPDPTTRYTTKQILEHPWINSSHANSKDAMKIDKLRGFRILTLLKMGMVDTLHAAENELFDYLDENKEGTFFFIIIFLYIFYSLFFLKNRFLNCSNIR